MHEISDQRLRTFPRFDVEARANSEMAYFVTYLSPLFLLLKTPFKRTLEGGQRVETTFDNVPVLGMYTWMEMTKLASE